MNKMSNVEAECGFIGSALIEPEQVLKFATTRKKINPESFYDKKHSIIWRTLTEMFAAKKPIDIITIAEYLEKEKKLQEIGGIEYLNSLLDATPSASHAEYYLDMVLQWATAREMAELEVELAEATRKGDLNECSRINNLISFVIKEHASNSTDLESFPPIKYNDLVEYVVPEGHIIAGNGWLRRAAGCLLTGGTSIGKSVLTEQIAVSVAAGVNILGCIKVQSPMKVTYIQAENDEETLKRDIVSIVKNIEADPDLVQKNLSIHHIYGLSGPKFDAWIEKQVIKQKTDLLIIDPYQNFIPAGMNINDASTFLSFIFNINRIIKEHNCAFLLVTHTPKPQDRENWTARESVYMAVGSQAIAAWARTSAEITGFKEDDTRYRLRFGKNAERNGIVTADGSGRLVRDLMIKHSPTISEPYWEVAENQEAPIKLSSRGAEIIKMATQNPHMSHREIARALGCSVSTVSTWYPKP